MGTWIVFVAIGVAAFCWWLLARTEPEPRTAPVYPKMPEAVPPPPRRPTKVERGALADWKDKREAISCPGLSGQTVQIVYFDSNDDESDRRIRCQGLSRGTGKLYLDAYCLERKAPRMFRLDRIDEVTDLATGEIFDGVAGWLASIGVKTDGIAGDGSDLLKEWPKIKAAAIALMYLARHDGTAHAKEKATAAGFVRERLTEGSNRPASEAEINACTNRVLGLFPTDDDLMEAMEWLRAKAHERQLAVLFGWMKRLAAADGGIDPREDELIKTFRFAVTAGKDIARIEDYERELGASSA